MSGFSGDEQARILYLSLLGLLLCGYLIHAYRGRLGTGLQHAAIWVLIFLGAMLAYGFKDNLAVMLNPGAARVEGDAVVLTRGRDGHFHATLEIDGTPVAFLVDTGASEMVLSRQDAARIGLALDSLAFTRPARTANGVVYGAPVRLGEVRFAGKVERGVPAVVNGGALATSLLGMRYLDRFARVEIQGDTLRLER
ncbi:TIGR02281 family clan AA aspartic protease [Paralimibaculum aggregatum]|uniref:TIGR02281 family clan AA aspartic protease n=1 Tax=Paralimibaculum aggregatum TaxID=3036245 RepID=A0ABQ6LJ89_9RHOB|nr:TIGR02281 family clan AA aspartic protease [Limibaculum sp. NKW23]GMG82295.1 TIGR02281 family clan AA aspartic protease [Limibaculum sp. NKW23]